MDTEGRPAVNGECDQIPITISILISRSIDLENMWDTMCTSAEEYISDMNSTARKARVSIVIFDKEEYELCRWEPIASVEDIPRRTQFRSGAKLFDAIAHEIREVRNFRAQNEHYGRSLIAVYTDGLDSGSKYSSHSIKKWMDEFGDTLSLAFPCKLEASEYLARRLGAFTPSENSDDSASETEHASPRGKHMPEPRGQHEHREIDLRHYFRVTVTPRRRGRSKSRPRSRHARSPPRRHIERGSTPSPPTPSTSTTYLDGFGDSTPAISQPKSNRREKSVDKPTRKRASSSIRRRIRRPIIPQVELPPMVTLDSSSSGSSESSALCGTNNRQSWGVKANQQSAQKFHPTLSAPAVYPTTVSILVDHSSSMEERWDTVRESVNCYMEKVRGKPGEILVSMAFFSKRTQELYRFIPAWKVRKLPNNIRMSRGTALYDTIAGEIGALQKFRAENPHYTRSNILVYTDGVDDSSKNFDSNKLKCLMQNAGVGWRLTFICRGDAVENLSNFLEVQHADIRDKDIRVATISIENFHLFNEIPPCPY